jgi:thioredoxin reductase/bacterioferritin-associated ferredoxin
MNKVELAIIGAGPGALTAALEAVSHGIEVAIFDDNAVPGGQYFRMIPKTFQQHTKTKLDHDKKDKVIAANLFSVTTHPKVHYLSNTVVWGLFDGNLLAYACGKDSGHIHADKIIVAMGAYDRCIPFPGWTLPGVMTAGGVQNLIKSQRIIPGKKILIAGNGPMLLAVAYALHKAGANVIEVLEASRNNRIMSIIPDLLMNPSILYKGLSYKATLMTAGIPVRLGQTVLEARGDERVEEVITIPIEPTGKVVHSRSRRIIVDTLVVGFGLNPSIEMTKLIGCEHAWDALQGTFKPVRSTDFETTVPGVFAVGDCAGIRGVDIAMIEGRLAGLIIAMQTGRISSNEAEKIILPLRSKLLRLNSLHDKMDYLFEPPENFLSLMTDDTVICRCEEVTAGQLRKLLRKGIFDMDRLKSFSRIGMGHCQGRNCFGTFAAIVAQEMNCKPNDLALPRVRQPLKPICLGDLLHEDLPPYKPPDIKLL